MTIITFYITPYSTSFSNALFNEIILKTRSGTLSTHIVCAQIHWVIDIINRLINIIRHIMPHSRSKHLE